MLIIRKQQMDAFADEMLNRFNAQILHHVRSFFPEQCNILGEEGIKEAIRYGIDRAASYGIEIERDVCLYIDLMFAFGRDFDKDPELPWSGEILSDEAMPDPTGRINMLHETSLRYVREAAGIQAPFEGE